MPDELTVRKLTSRIGAETVNELTRADREGDAGQAVPSGGGQDRLDGLGRTCAIRPMPVSPRTGKRLAREGKKASQADQGAEAAGAGSLAVDGRKLRAVTRTIRRRREAKSEVLELTEQTGELLARSVEEARKLAAAAKRTGVAAARQRS